MIKRLILGALVVGAVYTVVRSINPRREPIAPWAQRLGMKEFGGRADLGGSAQ